MGFCRAPWPCVGLAGLTLSSSAGLGSLAHTWEASDESWKVSASHLAWGLSFLVPLLCFTGLLYLADTLLTPKGSPGSCTPHSKGRLALLLLQALALVLCEALALTAGIGITGAVYNALIPHSGVLAGIALVCGSARLLAWLLHQWMALPLLMHHGHRPIEAMVHSRRLVEHNRLKVLTMIGLLLGLNLLGLMGVCLGLLLTLPLSALILMASCRTQTPRISD